MRELDIHFLYPNMAVSSLSLTCLSSTIYKNKLNLLHFNDIPRTSSTTFSCNNITCSAETVSDEEVHCKRRELVLGVGAITGNLLNVNSLFAEEIPKNFLSYVDEVDGYSYFYPADWREFDFRAHDSAFKDRYMQLHSVRVRFLPTDKKDIHDLGPMEQVITDLVKTRYAAPNQIPTIFSMTERNTDGKNYYTVEYNLTSRSFSVTCFATVAIGNERYYTQVVVANERRWKKFRNQLKVVADSFRVLDI